MIFLKLKNDENRLLQWTPHCCKAYINVVNAIAKFFKPTPSTNIINNYTIIIQYIIKQGLKVFVNKDKAVVKQNYSSSVISEFSNQRNPKTSVINSKEVSLHIWFFWNWKMMRSKSRGEEEQTWGNIGTGYIRKIRHHQPFTPSISCYRAWLTQWKAGR